MEALLFPLLLFGLMYVLLIRPQQQRVRAQRALVQSLEVGDEVITVGGLLGRVVDLDDEVATVEAAPGVTLRFRRVAISGRLRREGEGGGDAATTADEGH
ncbi:MAG: preprotein translocase subunit YajC [Acidimicrobiales bacterium]